MIGALFVLSMLPALAFFYFLSHLLMSWTLAIGLRGMERRRRERLVARMGSAGRPLLLLLVHTPSAPGA
jgi:hypothetical protein